MIVRIPGLAALLAGLTAGLILSTPPTSVASQASNCFVSDEPSADGPDAPSNLSGSWSPYYSGGYLLDAYDYMAWTDNSDDETCFVIEMNSGDGFRTVGSSSANYATWAQPSGYGRRTYRVYSASATERSAYSNVAVIDSGPTPITLTRTPSPTPSLSDSPTPSVVATVTGQTSTGPTAIPSPIAATPANLPVAGGPPDPRTSSTALLAGAFILGSLAIALSWRAARSK